MNKFRTKAANQTDVIMNKQPYNSVISKKICLFRSSVVWACEKTHSLVKNERAPLLTTAMNKLTFPICKILTELQCSNSVLTEREEVPTTELMQSANPRCSWGISSLNMDWI